MVIDTFYMGLKAYDQQFRLSLAADPTGICFDRIYFELWLLLDLPIIMVRLLKGQKSAMILITIEY
jgi:hypothetical protein